MNEVRNAIKQMNYDKAAGKEGIPADLYKALSKESLKVFQEVLASIWEEEEMPPDLCDATIIILYKNKGTRADFGNYRGMLLFFVTGKMLAHIILNRLLLRVSEESLPHSH